MAGEAGVVAHLGVGLRLGAVAHVVQERLLMRAVIGGVAGQLLRLGLLGGTYLRGQRVSAAMDQ